MINIVILGRNATFAKVSKAKLLPPASKYAAIDAAINVYVRDLDPRRDPHYNYAPIGR